MHIADPIPFNSAIQEYCIFEQLFGGDMIRLSQVDKGI